VLLEVASSLSVCRHSIESSSSNEYSFSSHPADGDKRELARICAQYQMYLRVVHVFVRWSIRPRHRMGLALCGHVHVVRVCELPHPMHSSVNMDYCNTLGMNTSATIHSERKRENSAPVRRRESKQRLHCLAPYSNKRRSSMAFALCPVLPLHARREKLLCWSRKKHARFRSYSAFLRTRCALVLRANGVSFPDIFGAPSQQ